MEEKRDVHSKGNNTDQVILVISIIIINAIIIISIIIIKAIIIFIFIFIFIVKLSQTLLLIGSIWELFPPTGSVSQPSASRLNPKISTFTFTLTSLFFTFFFDFTFTFTFVLMQIDYLSPVGLFIKTWML